MKILMFFWIETQILTQKFKKKLSYLKLGLAKFTLTKTQTQITKKFKTLSLGF